MYQLSDYEQNRTQLRQRLLTIGGAALALLAAMLVSFFLRWPEAVTTILCIVLCALCIFCYSLFIAPVIAYGKHIDHALHGRTRDAAGALVRLEEQSVLREGLYFYPLTINVGEQGKEEDDRLFYYDANLPRPDWQIGERLVVTSYDNRVTAWRRE